MPTFAAKTERNGIDLEFDGSSELSSQHGTGDIHIQPILQDVIHCFLPSFFGVIHIPEVLVVRTTPAP
jgi:hypothetical protein